MNRGGQCTLNDFNAGPLIACQCCCKAVQAVSQMQQCAATPSDNSLLDCGTGCIQASSMRSLRFQLGLGWGPP